MLPKIYAVLVGIDQYQKYPLSGCVNDIKAVEQWLMKTYNNPGELNILRLTDEDPDHQPVRPNIINAFNHFDQATGEDICLFYYCGHGVNLNPPAELSYEPALQALVCKDWAGMDDGNGFLVDKELAYLIWQKTQNKPDVSFVVITDCCHSGTITRDVEEVVEEDVRTITGTFTSPLLTEFVGYHSPAESDSGYYMETSFDGTEKLVVKPGRYIHLAAAQDDQKAYEITTPANQKRGGFTYYLIDGLEKFQGQVSYLDLFDYVGRNIQNYFISANKTKQQFPCFSVSGMEKNEKVANRLFFTKNEKKTKREFELYFDPRDATKGWQLDAGQIDGLSAGDIFEAQLPGSTTLQVKAMKVYRDYTFIADDLNNLDQTQRYPARATRPLQSAVVIYFDESIDTAVQQHLLAAWNQSMGNDPVIDIVFETAAILPPSVPYLRMDQGGVYLEYKENTFCLCEQFPGIDTTEQNAFWNLIIDNLGKAANWVRLVQFRNNAVSAEDSLPYKTLLKCTSGLNEKGELLFADRDPKERQIMNYLEGGKQPAFQLAVRNDFTDTLFVSFAYLSADGSIVTNDVFKWLTIEPGKTAAMEHTVDMTYDNISITPLAFEPEANDKNAYCTEYVKVFISKRKLITLNGFDQTPLTKQNEFSSRGLAYKKPDPPLNDFDWQAETICFTIQRKPSC